MANVWYERHRSRPRLISQSGDSLTLSFFAQGPTSTDEVEELAYVNTTPIAQGLVRQQIKIEPLGGNCYDVVVEYGVGDPSEALQPGDPSGGGGPGGGGGGGGSEAPADEDNLGPGYSLTIGFEQVHITQSLETIRALKPGDIPAGNAGEGIALVVSGGGTLATPDGWTVVDGPVPTGDVGKRIRITSGASAGTYTIFEASGGQWSLEPNAPFDGTFEWRMIGSAEDTGGAIGADGDTVHGCDIAVPVTQWSREVKRAHFSLAYKRTLEGLVGKWNTRSYYGQPKFTCLYLGASVRTGMGSKGLEILLVHNFFNRATQTGQVIGTGNTTITVPAQLGMDYLWVAHRPAQKRPTVEAVYVERVSKTGDFAMIEIGE